MFLLPPNQLLTTQINSQWWLDNRSRSLQLLLDRSLATCRRRRPVAGPEIKLSPGEDYNSNLFLSRVEHGCNHDEQFDLATSASEPGQVPRVAGPWVRHCRRRAMRS